MRKIFIDLGGHYGESVRRFYDQVDGSSDYLVYSFEAHPENYKTLLNNTKKYQNVQCVNKAASNKNGICDLFEAKAGQKMGSTTLRGKTSYNVDYSNPIKIEFVDFVQWMKENDITNKDYIVLKMNIEGSEYDLLEFMIEKDVLKFIKVLFVSFHSHKFESDIGKILEDREKKILNYINSQHIPIYYDKDNRKLYGIINKYKK